MSRDMSFPAVHAALDRWVIDTSGREWLTEARRELPCRHCGSSIASCDTELEASGCPKPLPQHVYVEHALFGEAFAARMLGDNPDLSEETRRAYRWAEGQFLRIARGEVGERDLIA